MSSSVLNDFLAQHNDNFDDYQPPQNNFSSEDKMKIRSKAVGMDNFFAEAVAKCMKPCLSNLNSAMVSESEADCMYNCHAKRFEVMFSGMKSLDIGI